MSNNLVAFGAHFSALGCLLEYHSEDASLSIAENPKKAVNTVVDAVHDIAKFEDTSNYTDGAASIALADYIDGGKTPLSSQIRENILVALGIKQNNKFIRQVLSLSKSNRAWHTSARSNDCSYFGLLCTSRGTDNANLNGRRSTRKPEDYHTLDGRGSIRREQLVTPALEKLFESIPPDNFTSGSKFNINNSIIKQLKNMNMDERLKILTEMGIAV
jgi:hypothetical protein